MGFQWRKENLKKREKRPLNPHQGHKKGSQFNYLYLSTLTHHLSPLIPEFSEVWKVSEEQEQEWRESKGVKESRFTWEKQWFLIWQLLEADKRMPRSGMWLKQKLLLGSHRKEHEKCKTTRVKPLKLQDFNKIWVYLNFQKGQCLRKGETRTQKSLGNSHNP